ncbi:MAG: hypothetical protein A2787_08010 [Omnitrophica WOR_2 bacterium RIFCSPHIGHO2_01_FULL_48_9]|nr:MAG: hypothetical protein A2787_08010 [Omnitrophica WOR_2 bacterium RIFCSPHIGHO2_01_FULL_48_9]
MHKKIALLFLFLELLWPQFSSAQTSVPFAGQIDFVHRQIQIKFDLGDKSFISVQASQDANRDVRWAVNIDHVATPLATLSTVLEGSLMTVEQDALPRSFNGKIVSRYTLADYKPMPEAIGLFEIKNQKLYIHSLSFGKISCQGSVDFDNFLNLDLLIKLSEVDMADFVWFLSNERDAPAAGFVTGEISIAGPWSQPALQGRLSSYEGFIKDLVFDSMFVNFEGIYPFIQLRDSSVTETNGLSFALDGTLNISEKTDFKKQFDSLSKSPLVMEDPSKLEWTFKRVQKENASSTTELKYLLQKKDSADRSDRKDSDMFGIERRVEF